MKDQNLINTMFNAYNNGIEAYKSSEPIDSNPYKEFNPKNKAL